ncbi:hypothetical protein HK098_000680, partial [Nowakowskiella sp. JEL0407]
VTGLSLDFLILNTLGFTCYSIYNTTLYYSSTIRDQYKQTFGGEPQVKLNDVAFGIHALGVTLITLVQYGYYTVVNSHVATSGTSNGSSGVSDAIGGRKGRTVSMWILVFTVSSAISLYASTVFGHTWILDVVYFLSLVKMLTSLVKYVPQAILNFERRSTVGWSILNIGLDFLGGVLSFAQLVGDCWSIGDWSGLVG